MSNINIKLSSVDSVIPSFSSIEKTQSVFKSSTITYNEGTVTYNQSNIKYGGADTITSPGPEMLGVSDTVSHMILVTDPTTTIPETVILAAGQPVGPGFFLYVTYPTEIVIDL